MIEFISYVNVLPIAGTSAWETLDQSRWWEQQSNLHAFFNDYNVNYPDESFIWSTDLNGIQLWRRWSILSRIFKQDKEKDHRDWIAGGASLSYYFGYMDSEYVNIIAHSHAYQVVAYACARYNLKVNNLITVSSPIRDDMDAIYRIARKNINHHLHIYDGGVFSDRIQILGELGASALFHPIRECKYADYNDPVGNVNHSLVLSNPNDFHYWLDRGWIDFLRTGLWTPPFPKSLEKETK